ncbi:MAG: ATP-binding cassette domain-containing protein [Rivularia sp. T60_A2020_040]|nr:ATP-binding cassette domain-containing protein [Rivularia sp. T60_A2020_040]
MTEQPLIQLKGVSKSFGSNKILDQVDFNIYQGDALGIIGPSGTGKSTILRIIAGLTPADEGEIFIQGVRREGLVEDGVDALGIGMVFQQAALFDSLTVDENVGFLLYQHSSLSKRRIRELVEEKLEMVGLPGVADRFPAELSGGMRKRVSFARAIISNPEKPEESPSVLLYDEPTAGLDPIASTIIEDLIRQLQVAEGTSSSYAIVTHQHSTIRRTADRIVFLYQGKVQWAGKVSEVDTTEHPSIRQFMSGNIDGPIKIAGA